MNSYLLHSSIWMRIKLPLLLLLTLLQRSPALRVISALEEIVIASPLGAVLKSTAAALASLGAMHSLAGATVLVSTMPSPASLTAGQEITPIGFVVTDTMNIARWALGGSMPPGLRLVSADGARQLTGPGLLDATTEGEPDGYGGFTGGIANTVPLLMGTPTQAGTYNITLQAMQGPLGLISAVFPYTINVAASGQPGTAPTFSTQPSSQTGSAGGSVTLTATASGSPTFEWRRNGTAVPGATGSSVTLNNLQPENTGIYQARATGGGTTASSRAAIVGLATTVRLVGPGTEFLDILHASGLTYDQILLGGTSAAVRADDGQILRISFLDMNDDIVQVECSGPGTLSLVLEGASGPAAPVKYNQGTLYMKGHMGIVLTGATENTHLSVFSVGRANAVNQNLFNDSVTYDGLADVAYIAISSANGQFGGLRAANASVWNTKGHTGIYAPDVNFTGPVFVGDIEAQGDATPVLNIGGGADVRVTGGNLLQANGRAVEVSGIAQLRFAAGSNSHGTLFAAQANRARLEQNGVDVTSQIVVNP